MRLWIDTDVGDNPDDAVALLCAGAHPAVDLIGVSTVGGDHDRRARRAHTLVPAPAPVTDGDGLAGALTDSRADALLAIGPLTNVAALAAAGVAIPPLVVMGGLLGTVEHRGVVQRVEYNFSRDPGAAATVLRAYAPVLVVPLDVTVSMRLDDAQLDALLEAAPALNRDVDAWLAALHAAGVPAADCRVCLHDPLALLALLEPTLVRVEPRRLRVEADGEVVEVGAAPEQHVVRSTDAPRAVARILELLARGVG